MVCWAPLKERVAGFDLMCNLFAKLSEENKPVSVFLLGAKPHVVQAAADRLTKTYSAVSIVGIQDGYFKQEEERILFLVFKRQNQTYCLLHLVSRDKRTSSNE